MLKVTESQWSLWKKVVAPFDDQSTSSEKRFGNMDVFDHIKRFIGKFENFMLEGILFSFSCCLCIIL